MMISLEAHLPTITPGYQYRDIQGLFKGYKRVIQGLLEG